MLVSGALCKVNHWYINVYPPFLRFFSHIGHYRISLFLDTGTIFRVLKIFAYLYFYCFNGRSLISSWIEFFVKLFDTYTFFSYFFYAFSPFFSCWDINSDYKGSCNFVCYFIPSASAKSANVVMPHWPNPISTAGFGDSRGGHGQRIWFLLAALLLASTFALKQVLLLSCSINTAEKVLRHPTSLTSLGLKCLRGGVL